MLSYEELLNKYNALIKENEVLKNQIDELKLKLGIPTKTEEKIIEEPSGTGINKYSTCLRENLTVSFFVLRS